ncbi:MAG TPA: hypothetical protein VGD67_11780 [Pseudonocardiaceae bacterium]
MSDRVPVPFHGDGAGVDVMSWGQMSIWQSILVSGRARTLGGVDALPPGTTIADAVATLRFALTRHPALRTRLRFDGVDDGCHLDPGGTPAPRQECAASGVVELELVDAAGDPAGAAAATMERLQRTTFAFAEDWPVRMAVVRDGDVLTHAVGVYLHLVLDAGGLTALMADLAHLGRGAVPPPAGETPLEQARRQATAGALRQDAASLRHLERVLRAAPASRFGPPRTDRPERVSMIRHRSPALLLACRAVAARDGVDTSPVLFAGFAVALARLTGRNPVFAMLMVHNRFRPGLAGSVSAVAQSGACLFDVAGLTVGEAVRRAVQLTIGVYKHAYYDPYRRDEVMARVNEERGEVVDFSCYFNDRRRPGTAAGPAPTEAEVRAAPRGTSRPATEVAIPQQKLFLRVDDAPGALDLTISADERYFDADGMAALAAAIEEVALEAALAPGRPAW